MLAIVMMVAMCIFFYRLGDYEDMDSPILWGVMSLLLSGLAVFIMGLGWLGLLASQLILLGALVVRKVYIEKRKAA